MYIIKGHNFGLLYDGYLFVYVFCIQITAMKFRHFCSVAVTLGAAFHKVKSLERF
mgnify:CR=1 FL=1